MSNGGDRFERCQPSADQKQRRLCVCVCVYLCLIWRYICIISKSRLSDMLCNSLAMTSQRFNQTSKALSPSSCRFRSQIPPTRHTCSGTASLWSTCTSWMRSTTLTGQIQSCSRRENRPWRRPGTSLLMSDRTEKRGTYESKEGG